MALGDLMASRLSQAPPPAVVPMPEPPVLGGGGGAGEDGPETSMPYFPQSGVLCESRHEGFEDGTQIQSGPSDEGLVSKWRLKDRRDELHKKWQLSVSMSELTGTDAISFQ